ncbi:MAG: T9SS type A sorting domain-containing protein [candidate division Zixibacteria bacterium]|nr:T9SS type A sorting domain-containing protein [candidate division Zixibacteria bacterium]
MKSLITLILILICLSSLGLAQAPDTAWTKTYHRDSYDDCKWITETSDNGFALVGVSQITGNTWLDIFLVRTDTNGDTLWTHTYGDTIIGQEAFCVKQDYDGGFVIAGIKHLTMVLRNAWIIKTDSNGDTLWTTMFGGTLNTEAIHVSCTPDSGYIVTGKKYDPGEFSNAYLLKLDSNGDTDWVRTFGGSGYEEGFSVQQTADGGYMLAGTKDVSGRGWDFYLIKTDSSGIADWSYTYGGDVTDHCTSAQQTSDGGYIMFGETDSNIPNSSLALKVNSDGDSIWCKNYSRSTGDYGWSVDQTSDGGYIFGGYSNNPGYRDDYWFVRTDANGDTLWMKTVGHGDDQRAYCILQSSDGGYVLAGESSEPNPTFGDFFVVKLNANPSAIDNDISLPSSFQLSQNYPNPFNASTEIRYSLAELMEINISIFDALGRKVESLYDGVQQAGQYAISWDASDQPSGIYFARLNSMDKTESIRMLLLK